ncbi:hypothetical protein AVEN_200765-1 [Araneus ventricosus]|uniref:Uncharacterized protein n=1 Tax=Araneus ventricosus TaxID=182803 RepID=A0A4Y2DYI2_ARAVE|nr:hypothetical protein AVEN_200765-1 [Araneus ventricosus]
MAFYPTLQVLDFSYINVLFLKQYEDYFEMGLAILNHSQTARTPPELAPLSKLLHHTGRRTFDPLRMSLCATGPDTWQILVESNFELGSQAQILPLANLSCFKY